MSRLYADDRSEPSMESRKYGVRTCISPTDSGHSPPRPSAPIGWPGAQMAGLVVQSPRLVCVHQDSLATWARSVSSSKPHLQAAHWMISSVVPVKLPVARGNSAECGPHVVAL